MVRDWRRLPLYWYWIVGLLVAVTVIYANHLRTAVTPSNIIFTIEALEFPVFWYGVWIAGGMGLGAYVVATLAKERMEASFQRQVPVVLQETAVSTLSLPTHIQAALTKRKIHKLGELLRQWGLNPLELGVKQADLETVDVALRGVEGIEPAWLDDAPWRQWNPDHVWTGLIWCLIPAVIGARLYHVLTPSPSMAAVGIHSLLDYFQNPYQLINLRNGGLGIYGGIAGGALGLWLFTRRYRLSTFAWADLAAVGVILGQVFGRWGNFFNQELYGSPTNVPWAVYIDPVHRLPQVSEYGRFHPAFLYESLWSLLTFIILMILLKRYGDKLLPGDMMGVYLIFYAIGRILLEMVRLDSRAILIAGFSINIAIATLVSLAVAIMMLAWMVKRRLF